MEGFLRCAVWYLYIAVCFLLSSSLFQKTHLAILQFHRSISFDIMRGAILTFGLTVLMLGASGYPLSIRNRGDTAMISVLNANNPTN